LNPNAMRAKLQHRGPPEPIETIRGVVTARRHGLARGVIRRLSGSSTVGLENISHLADRCREYSGDRSVTPVAGVEARRCPR
jgi:hypothetical protein